MAQLVEQGHERVYVDGGRLIQSFLAADLVDELESRGMRKLYIDGGKVVTSFLEAGLLDEITTTTIPVALGSGTPIFGPLENEGWFEHVRTEVLIDQLVQTTYRRAT